jgi:phosphoribosylformimino-5-aminoimidazole carboxamide ribotide isomerase
VKVIPVLDLKGGQVVRGVGGRREEYRPLCTSLVASSEPGKVAAAFRERFGLTELYLADLDAIAGGPPALETYAAIRAEGGSVWVDAGIRRATDAFPLARAGVDRIVIGLETINGPAELSAACRGWGERIIFSLDLRAGAPLGDVAAWEQSDPWSIAVESVAAGVCSLLVLDLARVGAGQGTGTEAFCARCAQAFPDLEVIAGGGVRGLADLIRLRDMGVAGALVASALHDGALRPEDLAAL